MGYMIMECGLGAFALAIFHLMAHGLFKATMFLNCGQAIHLARKEWALPHGLHELEARELPRPAWATGFLTTLLLPLIILLVSHGVLEIPLLESQGTVIFLFFAWVTSSQAILTLTRLRAVASWKVSLAMLLTLLLVVSTYLFAAEAFTAFLYPNPGDVAALFSAAALPGWLFDGLVVAATWLVVLGWVVVYASAHEHALPIPGWVDRLRIRLYVVLMNRLYLDALYFRVGQAVWRLAKSLDPVAWGQRP
jgi:NADH-quinone oxidoreductase subunit L